MRQQHFQPVNKGPQGSAQFAHRGAAVQSLLQVRLSRIHSRSNGIMLLVSGMYTPSDFSTTPGPAGG